MLTLLTMTGERPEAWELCKRWMRNQTFRGEVHWVIVDDGRTMQSARDINPDWGVTIIRREPFWQPGENTQAANILAGIAHLHPEDRLVVIEDDDYYAPDYLRTVDGWLDDADLVGESHTLYCNVASGVVKRNKNDKHASLCATGMKGDAIHLLREVAAEHTKFVDLWLWRWFRGSKYLSNTDNVIGIKGLPGRAGIGAGHRMGGTPDFAQMRNQIGEDFQHYERFSGVTA